VRRFLPLSFLSITVPALLALPVATTPQPDAEPVRPELERVALAGVDHGALEELGSTTSGAPRPVVLTGKRRTGEFSTLGVTWADDGGAADVRVSVRTRADGRWTGWTPLEDASDDGPDDRSGEARSPGLRRGTAPMWAGASDGVQVRVDVPAGPAPRDLRLELVEPGESPADAVVGEPSTPSSVATASTARPPIVSRAQWGADESLRSGSPSYSSTIQAAYVHHTASTNDYTAAQAAAQVRGIYAYHTRSLGWSDVGYNFLVDKFGRIYEGRAGGVERAVVGAHAGGFNTSTMGLAMMGTYTSVAPSAVTLDAVRDLLAWKLSLYGRNPTGKTTLTSGGGSSSKYPAGTRVSVNVILGHRETNSTACPGDVGNSKLPGLRTAVAGRMSATSDPISTKRAANDWLGAATAAESQIAGGRQRPYQNGTIYWSSATGAFIVHGAILGRYQAFGGPAALGFPTSDEVGVTGGRASVFSHGNIYWGPSTGAHPVYGAILAKYVALGGAAGFGLPTTGEVRVRGGVVTRFTQGHIYWSSGTGAREVHGMILGKYLALGGADGFLGLPRTDETPVVGGRANEFVGGTIYWGPSTGARVVHGAIRDKYLALGGTGSFLGLPSSDEVGELHGRRSAFVGGRVYWSPATGAREVRGLILERYLKDGGPAAYGFPTTDEHSVAVGRASGFERAVLTWDARTGAVTVAPR
jgi:uncharacterized protein with LGFP repeats